LVVNQARFMLLVFSPAMIWLAAVGLFLLMRGGAVGRGLELEMAGQPAEAEKCYRKALARSGLPASKRAEALACLGGVLADMGRYEESRQCLYSALAMGDPKGGCRSNIAELLLLQGIEAEKALDMADQALRATTTGCEKVTSTGRLGQDAVAIARASICGKRAWALARLGRQEESAHAIDTSLRFAIQASADVLKYYSRYGRARRLARAALGNAYWLTGMALLAMKEGGKASEHFQKGSDADRSGKYGALCRKQLALLGGPFG